MRKRILFWLFYAATLILVPLFCLEILARALELGPELPAGPQIYYKADHLPYLTRPNIQYETRTSEFRIIYDTNSQGWRDYDHSEARVPGVKRILALGDSFTFGIGATLKETFPRRLEILLNQALSPQKVEIIKAGVPGYEAKSERLLYEYYGAKYRPDVVMVAFVPNDLYEIIIGVRYEVTRDGHLLSREGHELGPAAFWLYRHSRAARIFLKKYAEMLIRIKYPEPKNLDTYVNEKGWRLTEREYGRILAICRQNHAKMVVINIPVAEPWKASDLYAGQRLGRWCKTNDVTFVDILDKMNRAGGSEGFYWTLDQHCTPAGYDFIAKVINEVLITQRVLE